MNPVAFLVVGGGEVRLLPIDDNAIFDRLLDMAPRLLEQVQGMIRARLLFGPPQRKRGNCFLSAERVLEVIRTWRRGSSPERPAGKGERLQKVMAAAGVASRRACEELIRAGRVQVNGVVVTELGVRVDPERDVIAVDGRILPPPARRDFTYFLMHKPKGVLTTMHDPHGRPTVADLLPRDVGRVFPVGRLDQDSSGLLLFTNDGELAQKLLHPRYGVPKTYRVTVRATRRRRRWSGCDGGARWQTAHRAGGGDGPSGQGMSAPFSASSCGKGASGKCGA